MIAQKSMINEEKYKGRVSLFTGLSSALWGESSNSNVFDSL